MFNEISIFTGDRVHNIPITFFMACKSVHLQIKLTLKRT